MQIHVTGMPRIPTPETDQLFLPIDYLRTASRSRRLPLRWVGIGTMGWSRLSSKLDRLSVKNQYRSCAETVGRFDVACGLDTIVDEMRAVVETLH